MLIPGYSSGSDISILDTSYIGKRKNENGKMQKDYLCILFKDNVTGEKHHHIIEEPEYTYYKAKENVKVKHNLFFIEKEKVEPVTAKYSDILKDIAEKTGNEQFFYDNIRCGNYGENRRLYTLKDIFMADINIEDYYRMLFSREYKNDPIKLNKSYFDIETDGRYQMGDFPEYGEVPINAISFLDERTKISYQFLLENDENPLINQYKNILKNPETIQKLKKFITASVGGYKFAKRLGVDNIEYKFLFFKDEIQLIDTFFKLLHKVSPDIIMAWNMEFDLNYIIERIKVLGYDPMDIICDPRIKKKFLRFYVDERNKNEYAERGDFVNVSQYTVWLDQMIQFASRRKGRGQFPNFKLDAIGEAIAKVNKLDYSHITTNIAMLPYLNFLVFSWYNIMDTMVQKCIEAKTNDVDYIYAKCLINNTKYSKGHRQSVYLANRFTKDFYDYGYIIGNNINKWNEKPNIKYPGAQVGDPLHNSTYAVVFLNGRPTLIACNVVDFDYKALYPSIVLENNMAPNTQYGKYDIPDKVSYAEHEDMYASDEQIANYSRGGEFLENMMSGCHLEFCKRWLHLGDFRDVVDDIHEYFDDKNHIADTPIEINPRDVIYFGKDTTELVRFQKDHYHPDLTNVVFFYNDIPKASEELISDVTKGAFI